MNAPNSSCVLNRTIDGLTAQIQKIRRAQKLMALAERALKAGRDDVLRKIGFSDKHIETLKQTAAMSEGAAFPNYVRRNNAATIAYLRREVAVLRRHLCSCAEDGTAYERGLVWATVSREL